MRTAILTTAAICIFQLAFGNHNSSEVNIHLSGFGKYIVFFNGSTYQPQHGSLSFSEVPAGKHHLKITEVVQSPYACNPVQKIVYNGNVFIKPRSIVNVKSGNYGQLTVQAFPKQNTGYGNTCGTNGFYGSNTFSNNYTNTSVTTCDMTNGYGYNNYGYNNEFANGSSCSTNSTTGSTGYGLSNFQYRQVLTAMQRTSFDRDRLIIAQQAIRFNGATSAQVLGMMKLLSFESTRLKLAKSAYGNVVDPQNFYIVYNGFNFSSSIHQLEASIY